MAESDAAPAFKLNNSSDSFSIKSNDIFGCLSVLEKKHEAYQKAHSKDDCSGFIKADPEEEEEEERRPNRIRRSERDSDSRKHSEFTRPYPPPRFRPHRGRGKRCTPDFKLNPQRWTKYTLDDVDKKDMTDSSNTRAAFEFLEERKRLREMEADPDSFKAANVEETACSRGAITFVRKKKDKSGMSSEKGKDVVIPMMEDLEGEESGIIPNVAGDYDEDPESHKEEVKVSFKSKKVKKRNIRTRPNEDQEEDQKG